MSNDKIIKPENETPVADPERLPDVPAAVPDGGFEISPEELEDVAGGTIKVNVDGGWSRG